MIARLREQLLWAIQFVEREIEVMEASFLDANGNWDDEQAEAEVADAKRWLTETRAALQEVA